MPFLVYLVVIVVCCLSATVGRAADPWKAASVFPKSAHVRFADEAGRDTGSIFNVQWPARVERVDGHWLLIRDSGGYSAPPFSGWVPKADMLRSSDDGAAAQRTEDPRTYYTEQIELNPTAPNVGEFHWLRGIYFESQDETDVALQDYCAAANSVLSQSCGDVCLQLRPAANAMSAKLPAPSDRPGYLAAADACLRLGKLLAQKQIQDEAISDDKANVWQEAFASARKTFDAWGEAVPKVPPALNLEWGKTAFQWYKVCRRREEGNAKPSSAEKATPAPSPDSARVDRAGKPPVSNAGSLTNARSDVKPSSNSEKQAGYYFDLAAEKFEEARKANGGWSEPYLNLGELYLAKGEPLSSRSGDDSISPSLPMTPSNANAAPSLAPNKGTILPNKGPTSKRTSPAPELVKSLITAINWFDTAIRVDPRLDQAYSERATAMLAQANIAYPDDNGKTSTLNGSSSQSSGPGAGTKAKPPAANTPPKYEPRVGEAPAGPAPPGTPGTTPAAPGAPSERTPVPCPSASSSTADKSTTDKSPAQSPKQKLLRKAALSADAACRLKNYQDPKGLELLAEIGAALAKEVSRTSDDTAKAYYDQAAGLARNAAQVADDAADKSRLNSFADQCTACMACPEKCKITPAVLLPSAIPLVPTQRRGLFSE